MSTKYNGLDLLLRDAVLDLVQTAKQIEDTPQISDLDRGRKIGYVEAIRLIRSHLWPLDDDGAFALDFDIDKELYGIDIDELLGASKKQSNK